MNRSISTHIDVDKKEHPENHTLSNLSSGTSSLTLKAPRVTSIKLLHTVLIHKSREKVMRIKDMSNKIEIAMIFKKFSQVEP